MIVLYNILDFFVTITEAVIYYIVASRFCVMPENKVRKYFPFVFLLFTVYGLTWFGNFGEYKGIVITIYMTLIFRAVYRIDWIQAAIIAMLSMVILVLADSLGIVIASFFAPQESIMVGSHMVFNWPVYLMAFLCKIGITIPIYYLFKGFLLHLGWRDLLVVLINFALVEILLVFTNREFFSGNSKNVNVVLEIITIIFSLGILITFFYFKNYYILRKKEQHNQLLINRMETRFSYYQDRQKEEERIRSIYHDLKNHLLVLKSQIGTMQEANETIESLQEQIMGYENYHHTGNEFLDIIIRDKSKQAQEKQIDFNVAIQFETGCFMESLDISTIFGNALDNAIEACEKLPPDMRLISAKASHVRDMLIIVVENTLKSDSEITEKTTKKDTWLHSFGVLNIRKAVDKYGGQCHISHGNGKFILKIMIPIPLNI